MGRVTQLPKDSVHRATLPCGSELAQLQESPKKTFGFLADPQTP